MIFQVYQTFAEYNQTGAEATLTYVADVVPIFIPLVLFSFFIITMLSSYYFTKRFGGNGNFIGSFAVAGYLTTLVAFSMTLIDGLINSVTVVTCLVVAIVGTLLLLFSNR